MVRTAALLVSIIGFSIPAIAQHKEPGIPENTIDCKQFKKTGPEEWIEAGTAVFDLGTIKDINLTNQPVTPRHYKFGGIDLYTVVEQKCGTVTYVGNLTAEARGAPEIGAAVPGPELKTDKSAPAPTRTPTQPTPTEAGPVLEEKIAKNQPEGKNQPERMSCEDRKSIYVADGLGEPAGGRAQVEIVFKNKMDGYESSGPNSEFIIREYKNNELEWVYKGKNRQGRFMFTPLASRHINSFGDFISTSARHDSVVLVPSFVKPKRDGTGEPILYLSGLRALFASKETTHHFKFEGKPPSEFLPEAFYFDRCE